MVADRFLSAFPPTLPVLGTEAVPGPGRHVRCTAETASQIYDRGSLIERDSRGRITARAAGLPSGWFLRLTIVDVTVAPVTPTLAGSRADPAVLRAQRQMSDPALAAALTLPLRAAFPGRPIQTDLHSFFVTDGLAFIREASVAVPLEASGDDSTLFHALASAASAAQVTASPTAKSPRRPPTDEDPPAAPPPRSRGHLRIIQ